MNRGFTLFETAIGRCGIAWDDTHILAVRLPAGGDAATAGSLRKHCDAMHPAAPPPLAAAAMAAITTHLSGRTMDAMTALASVPLDFSRLSPFDRSVLAACRRIRSGTTRTYGEIAKEIGDPQAARAVGAALGRNPWPVVVPCHRVLAANGKLGGFSAPGGRASKIKMLEIEGAIRTAGPSLFDVGVV